MVSAPVTITPTVAIAIGVLTLILVALIAAYLEINRRERQE